MIGLKLLNLMFVILAILGFYWLCQPGIINNVTLLFAMLTSWFLGCIIGWHLMDFIFGN